MQRRWAAIYIVFFLVMAASAYSVMALAEEPSINIQGDTFSEGDTLEAGGVTYTFAEVAESEGSIEFEEQAQQDQTFANNSVIEYRDGEYNVTIASGEEPDSFTLTEEFDVESRLQNDTSVENSTFTRDDGTEMVVYRNGTTQPLSEYLPEPNRETFTVGDTIEHDGVSKTVDSVSPSGATVTWEESTSQSISLEEGDVVDVGGTEYVVTFVEADTVMLSTDIDEYRTIQENREGFQQRMSGLLYVVIFSLTAGFLVAGMAFLPRRG
jgi:sorbitol-specific phosphotransferase system component IIA